MRPSVVTGLDRLSSETEVGRLVSGRRVGLLAHAASVNRSLDHATQVLQRAGGRIEVLFGPEHGFVGAAQDMIGVVDAGDAPIPIRSLYGETENDLKPKKAWLRGLDAVVIDLQDVGARYYTYVWSAALMMRACMEAGVETIVLDRPNPLGGVVIEGAPQREGYRSFVGLYDVSVRHGLTIAEMLRWVCAEDNLAIEALRVVPMKGWRRSMYFDDTGLPWVMPSPNMPTLDTAIVYPGGCLIEGTQLSEGRGTTRPFELWGGPGLDLSSLDRSHEGAALRPVTIQPAFHKHAGTLCAGIQVHVNDRDVFRSFNAYLSWIAQALVQLPAADRWRTETYEYVSDRLAIDLLTGGPEYRECVDSGSDHRDFLRSQDAGARLFDQARRDVLLYD